jgi:hypothetical protein
MSLPAAVKAPAFLAPLFRHGQLVAQFNHGEFDSKVLYSKSNRSSAPVYGPALQKI